jgi:hypothetical protein
MSDFEDLDQTQLRRLNRLFDIRETRIKFAKEYHRNTKGEKMNFERFPHVIAWYETVAPEVVIVGAAQVCKSEWLVIDMLANSFCGCNCFTILPKYEHRDIYAATRVKKPILTSPEYKKILKEGKSSSTQLIEFGKGMIKFVGANVESDFVEYAADSYYVEETDKITTWSNVELGKSRLQASTFKFKRWVSNPSTKDGKIWEMYLKTDQRVWKAKCSGCGEFSEMDWFESVVRTNVDSQGNVISYSLRDEEWTPGLGRDIYVKCPKCGCGNLQRFHKDNHWFAKEPEIKVEGYHAPSIISSIVTVEEMWLEFISAKSNPTKLQWFYNMRLGLPFTTQGNSIPTELLASCTDPNFELVITPECARITEDCHPGPCTMGVDVSPSRLDVRISVLEGNKRRGIYFGKLASPGRWEELHELIERYNVACCCIDIGPEVEKCIEFQSNAKTVVWRVNYLGAGSNRGTKFNMADRILTIDRTVALDRGYTQLKTKKNILPANFQSIFGGEYTSEMISLVREFSESKDGAAKFDWVGKPETDHSRHVDAYDLLAAECMADETLDGSNLLIL